MADFNYISTCIEATSVNDGVVCNFIKKNYINLVLVKNNLIEIYSVKDVNRLSFLTDEVSMVKKTLILQKKYYTKDKITIIKAVRPFCGLRDNLLVLTYPTDLLLLKYDRKLNDIVTIGSIFAGTHMYPFSEVEHLCCINLDHSYAALRLNCELIKIVRLEPSKGCRRLESKSFHIDDSIIINMSFLPDENDRILLAMITERGNSRYITVYELLFGSVQAVRIFGTIDGIDISTTQLITFNYYNSGALVLSCGSLSYYNDYSVHNFIPQFSIDIPLVSACILDPHNENTVIIAVDLSGNLFQITRVHDDYANPFAVQPLGRIPTTHKLIHLENGLIFACSNLGDSFVFNLKDVGNTIQCDFIDIHSGFGPIIDMIRVESKDIDKKKALVLCSGAGLDGTLRILVDGFVINENYIIDSGDCTNIWLIVPSNEPKNNISDTNYVSDHYGVVLGFPDKTLFFEMNQHEGRCINIPSLMSADNTLFAACTHTTNSTAPTWIHITPFCITLIELASPHIVVNKWIPNENEQIINVSNYYNNMLAISTEKHIHILNIDVSTIKIVNTIMVECIYTLSLSYSTSKISNYIAYNIWGEKYIKIVDINSGKEIVSVTTSKKRSMNSIIVLETVLKSHIVVFYSFNDGTVGYTDIEIIESLQDGTKEFVSIKKSLSFPLCSNSRLSIVHMKEHNKFFIVNCCENTTFIELNYDLIVDNNNQNTIVPVENDHFKLFGPIIVDLRYSNIPLINCIYLSPYTDNEFIYLTHNSIIFGELDLKPHYVQRSLSLYETPMKICYQNETNTLGLLTARPRNDKYVNLSAKCEYNNMLLNKGLINACNVEHPNPISQCSAKIVKSSEITNDDPNWEWVGIPNIYSLTIFDKDTLLPMCTHQFGSNEDAMTLDSLYLGHPNSPPYYVVSSNVNVNPDNTSYRGYVRVLQIKHRKMICLDTAEIDGLVLSVAHMNGKLIVGVSGVLQIYELNKYDKLVFINKFECGIVPAFFKVYNKELLVGDIMNNTTVMEMTDNERGILKITLQSEMSGWTTSAHILKNGMYMNANVERNISIFTKERVFKSEKITNYITEIDGGFENSADEDLDDENDVSICRLIDDESRKKILEDNPKKYKIIAKHNIGDHINAICHGPFRELFKQHDNYPYRNNNLTRNGNQPTNHNCKIDESLHEIHRCDQVYNREKYTSSGSTESFSDILTLAPSYSVVLSGSSGCVKAFYDISTEQFEILSLIQQKIVQLHQHKHKGETAIDRNNNLIYSKNLKKTFGGFIDGDVTKHVLTLPRNDALNLLSNIPIYYPNHRDKNLESNISNDTYKPSAAFQTEPINDTNNNLQRNSSNDNTLPSYNDDEPSNEDQSSSTYKSVEDFNSNCNEQTNFYPPEILLELLIKLNLLL